MVIGLVCGSSSILCGYWLVTEKPHAAESHSANPPGCQVHMRYSIHWSVCVCMCVCVCVCVCVRGEGRGVIECRDVWKRGLTAGYEQDNPDQNKDEASHNIQRDCIEGHKSKHQSASRPRTGSFPDHNHRQCQDSLRVSITCYKFLSLAG